jgi:hypothetical protein
VESGEGKWLKNFQPGEVIERIHSISPSSNRVKGLIKQSKDRRNTLVPLHIESFNKDLNNPD